MHEALGYLECGQGRQWQCLQRDAVWVMEVSAEGCSMKGWSGYIQKQGSSVDGGNVCRGKQECSLPGESGASY